MLFLLDEEVRGALIDKRDEHTSSSEVSPAKTVYHAGQRRDFTVKGSFGYAFCGIAYAFRTQRNLKIHLAIGILGFLLEIDASSWLAIALCIFGVFAAELINTSIESVVDMVSPQWSELAKRAKDCAAGAVCVSAFGSVVIAAIVFIPRLLSLLNL